MTGLWRRLQQRLRPAPIATPGALRTFLEERAALIAQKCAHDYCRGKTGLASYALYTEARFLDAFEVCRWETFAAVLGDLVLLAEGQLRAEVPPADVPRLRTALGELYSAALPPVAHRPEGWSDAIEAFGARLKAAPTHSVPRALDVADHSAKRLFDTLPIHLSYRELDEEVVYGAVRFRMIAVNQEMQQRLAAPDVARQLVA